MRISAHGSCFAARTRTRDAAPATPATGRAAGQCASTSASRPQSLRTGADRHQRVCAFANASNSGNVPAGTSCSCRPAPRCASSNRRRPRGRSVHRFRDCRLSVGNGQLRNSTICQETPGEGLAISVIPNVWVESPILWVDCRGSRSVSKRLPLRIALPLRDADFSRVSSPDQFATASGR